MAKFISKIAFWRSLSELPKVGRTISVIVLLLIVLLTGLGMYWSSEPEPFDVVAAAKERAESRGYLNNSKQLVTGYTTTNTLYSLVDTLLEKPGGFLSNDVMPPGVLLDNMPAWKWE